MDKAIYRVNLVSTTPIRKSIIVQVNEKTLEDLRAIASQHEIYTVQILRAPNYVFAPVPFKSYHGQGLRQSPKKVITAFIAQSFSQAILETERYYNHKMKALNLGVQEIPSLF